MTANLGNIDHVFRLVLGIARIAAPFVSGLALFIGKTATIISAAAMKGRAVELAQY